MVTVRIGVFDKEASYAGKLSVYLNRMGKGSWSAAAFTDKEVMERCIKKGKLDILAGTDREVLKSFRDRHKELYIVWLREGEGETFGGSDANVFSVCRYTSAGAIGKTIGEAAARLLTGTDEKKSMVAVYSPIGRCGKTTMALNIVRNENFGKWLYIGMEDYGFLETEEKEDWLQYPEPDNFLYFVKERNQEKLYALLSSGRDIIPSAFSPFDTKQVDEADIKWLFTLLQQIEMYSGVLFDIGTGILQQPEWLAMFDHVVVPFLPERVSMGKKTRFEQLIDAYNLEELKEKMTFLNMGNKEEVVKTMEVIGKKAWPGQGE